MARITFVVNTTGLTGGIRVVFEYANRLQERGHQVTIAHALDLEGARLLSKKWWRFLAKRAKYTLPQAVSWFKVEVPIIRVPQATDRYLPDADAVIATANETADWVAKLDPAKGEKFYFIQHFEDWTRDPELVKATWKLPLKKIVIASWMKKFAADMGEEVVATITNGVNFEEFYCTPDELPQARKPRVLMMTHTLPWKGTADGLRALKQVQDSGREFDVTLFSVYPLEDTLGVQAEFLLNQTGDAARKLYCGHDIFISPSWAEGCQLPPMEAMACQCAVLATNVGGVPDYAVAGETAVVVEPKHPDQIAEGLIRLLDDPTYRQRIAEAGNQHIQQYTWDNAATQFEEALLSNISRA